MQNTMQILDAIKSLPGWAEISLEQLVATHAYYHMHDVDPNAAAPAGTQIDPVAEAVEARRQAQALEALYRLEFAGKRIFVWEAEYGHPANVLDEFTNLVEEVTDHVTWFRLRYQPHYVASDYGTRYAGGALYRLSLGGSPFASGCDTYLYAV